MKSSKLLLIASCLCITGMISCKGKSDTKGSSTDTTGATNNSTMDKTVADNIEKSKTFYPMFENGDWAGIEKICSPDFRDHSPMADPNAPFNRDTLMTYLKATKAAFPDMKIEWLHAAGSGDMVFVHYHFTGTNTGAFMGMPATNKKVDYMGVDLLKIKDGVAVEHWDYADNVTYMKQMGMMPGD